MDKSLMSLLVLILILLLVTNTYIVYADGESEGIFQEGTMMPITEQDIAIVTKLKGPKPNITQPQGRSGLGKLDNELLNLFTVNNNTNEIIPINSTDEISIFIALNKSDNVSKIQKNLGGKNVYWYDQPGELGRILEQKGAKLLYYHDDLRGYDGKATPKTIKELIDLDFVYYFEKARTGTTASGTKISSIESTDEKIPKKEQLSEKEIEVNMSRKEPLPIIPENNITEEEEKLTPAEKPIKAKEEPKSLLSKLLQFFKSLFRK